MAGVFGNMAMPFAGCFTLLVATILHVLSFIAPYWHYTADDGNYGLWRRAICRLEASTDCYRYNIYWSVAIWLDVVRALECLTLIFWTVPLMIIPVYIYVALGFKYRCLIGSMALSVLIGAICNVVGAIIYGVEIGMNDSWRLGWCLVVCIVGGALGFVSFVILVIAALNRPEFSLEPHHQSGFYVDPEDNKLYVVDNFDRIETLSEKSNPMVMVS